MTPDDVEARRTWLLGRHAGMRTPRAIIDAQVRAAVGTRVQSLERLIVGEDNEVYDARTDGGDRLIVRISHEPDPRFEAERWALDTVRAAGVPTPAVLQVQAVALADGRTATFCVEEKLPGTPLDVLLDNNVWPERAIRQLGEILSAIHGIPIDGFGYLQPDGRGWPITFESVMTDLLPRSAQVLDAARHWKVDDGLVATGLDHLAGYTDLYQYDDSRLLHGDFSLDHILIDGDEGHEHVSGIIDMQGCSGGHPVSDIAYWQAISHERIPITALLASYPGGPELVEREKTLITLMMLRRALWMLTVDRDRDTSSLVGTHVRALQDALAAL